MRLLRMGWVLLLVALLSAPALARKVKPCVTIAQATQMVAAGGRTKDVCVLAHIYDVVWLPDGTRFLDVCSPQTPDRDCRFTIESLWGDHGYVGDLNPYRGQDVRIRGIVQPMRGRAGMLLSNARQFHGGPPRFRPNPLLARGFDAGSDRPPLYDPNLRRQGERRAFMNSRDQEARPGK